MTIDYRQMLSDLFAVRANADGGEKSFLNFFTGGDTENGRRLEATGYEALVSSYAPEDCELLKALGDRALYYETHTFAAAPNSPLAYEKTETYILVAPRIIRRLITFTSGFDKAVARYQDENGISSWSQAIIELAARQLNFTEVAAPTWGGSRKEATVREVFHTYTIQSGRSSTLILPENGKWYAVHEAWEGSRLLNTSTVAGPFDTPEEAWAAADKAEQERKNS